MNGTGQIQSVINHLDEPTEARILSQEHFTHAALPNAAQHLVVTDPFAYDSTWITKHLGSRFSSHCFDRISSLIVRRDKRFHFAAQRCIASAGLCQKCRALRRLSLEYGLEKF
jgi:hypothetical protein